MFSSLEKRVWIGTIATIVLVASFFVGATILRVFSIERITYPKATSDLSVIETWSESEVHSFAEDLGCFNIPYNKDFKDKFPEAVEFCSKVRGIWAGKYDKRKENNMNWELYHSLDKGKD